MSKVTTLNKPLVPASMSNDELLRAIRTRMKLTVKGLEDLADLIREARRRHLSLVEFSTGLPKFLISVADGTLDASVLLAFCNHSALLNAIGGVPLDQQKKLAKGDTLAVVEFDRLTGDLTVRQKTLRQLTGPQARQVFAEGSILPVEEQKRRFKSVMRAAGQHVSKQSTSAAHGIRVTADVPSGKIVVGAVKLNPSAFVGAFKALGFKIERIT